ncbi:oxidoreductase [Oleiagrimonas sp. MCCC 1A03011]|jgi:predicted dehydrogenase|uniref:oxidoreductase n=1 Tax=Oleiagrimonas sp. MCCC 1A03011 TaxID=1926883 RepID=UPI000DC3F521|nr:oxidoreductase [Oleiagrimonas sp. MCCC 1A03011]RAP59806.1 oxidoreductase [Oleiagrimonas sp. MCCC 1A03011]
MSTPNASRPLRVGLIGYGYAGCTFHAPLIGAVDGMDVAVVASSQPVQVQRDIPHAEVVADAAALIAHEDVDLVVIAAPNAAHAPLAEAALRAGKHVVVDKPFVLDLAQARHVTRLAKESGCVLSVFQNRRWDSDFLAVSEAIAAGRIGRVVQFESRIDRFRPEVRERWREQAVPGAGLWFDLGPHLIDQALVLFGLPQRVTLHRLAQRSGGVVDDWFHAVLDYGVLQVILHAGMLVAGDTPRFLVHGERGSLCKQAADPQETQLREGMRPGAEGWGEDSDPLRLTDGNGEQVSLAAPSGDHRLYYAAVRDAVLGIAQPPVTPVQALALMAVLEAGAKSARAGASEDLDLSSEEWAAAQADFPALQSAAVALRSVPD